MGNMQTITREYSMLLADVAANGTLANSEGLIDGASGTGSCTYAATGTFTFVYPKAFSVAPKLFPQAVAASDALAIVVSSSTTGCVIQTYAADGTTAAAKAFSFMAIGKQGSLT